MKRAIARSRCEVSGKVYLPGDDMTLTQEQFEFLRGHNAVTEIVLRAAMPPLPRDATIEDIDAMFARKLGKPVATTGVGKRK